MKESRIKPYPHLPHLSKIFSIYGILVMLTLIFGLLGYVRFIRHQNLPRLTHVTYSGTLPCADCSGIQETLILSMDPQNGTPTTYTQQDVYTGKSIAPFISNGTWQILRGTPQNLNAEIYILMPSNHSQQIYLLKTSDTTLEYLDQNKQKTDSPTPQILTLQ